jgi:hypothetical protein
MPQVGEDPAYSKQRQKGHWCGGGPAPPSAASVGRPINNTKAKAEGNGTASPTAMGASIDMLIAEVVSNWKDRDDERDEKND